MMKSRRILTGAVAVFLCLVLAHRAEARCLATDVDQILIEGPTDKNLVDCVRLLMQKSTKSIVINSNGGPVAPAMEIADLIAPHRPRIIVRGSCDSSCANYILPMASSVRLEAGAMIRLHGGVDEGLQEFTAAARGTLPPNSMRDVTLQRAFLAKYDVKPGWLLQRSADDYRSGNLGLAVVGKPKDWNNNDTDFRGITYLVVEELFVKSCLPRVNIEPFVDTAVQRAQTDKKLRAKLSKQRLGRSGPMTCAKKN
jgi:hypothetical protein